MRISDWSSDVCSSDLNLALGHRGGQRTGVDVDDARTRVRFLGADRELPAEPAARRSAHRLQRQREQARGEDRKSVVEGKSVSLSVDLGGSRIIKKKKMITKYDK